MTQRLPEVTRIIEHPAKSRVLVRLASAELGLLGVQFVLGMILNLFITIPANSTLSSLPIASLTVLILHIIVAFALIAIGIVLIALAARSRLGSAISVSLIIVVGVAAAFLSGLVFLYGGQNNVYSFIMALGFLVATAGTRRIQVAVEK